MYYGTTAGTICLAGCTSTSTNPTTSCGFYNGMWGLCTSFGVNGNYSLACLIVESCDPTLNTNCAANPPANDNLGVTRYQGRLFSVNLLVATGGEARFTSPIATPFSSAATRAYKCQSMSNIQNYITTNAQADYGYEFVGYREGSSSGTFITSTANHNWYFNSTYGGKAFAYIKNFYVDFADEGPES